MKKYVVATVEEITPGERKIVEIEGRSIGVFNIQGTFYAIRNRCPHAGAPLCEGVVSGFVTSKSPGEYTYSRQGEILRCPWHQWEFDVKTGQSYFDPAKTRVRTYQAEVEAGCSLVGDDDTGMAKGPFVAETYQVALEKEYVVVVID